MRKFAKVNNKKVSNYNYYKNYKNTTTPTDQKY